MKKRLPALLLALSLLTLPALAKENSMDNFIRGGNALAYTGQFSDLSADNPFYENVSALYEYGLSVGKADGTFGLKDDLTVSQAVIFAGRIRSLYRTGDAEAGPAAYASAGQAVCEPYLAYLKAEGLLGDELDSVLFAPATRAQMAHVLANVLPGKALPARNHDLVTQAYATRRFIPDVTEYTPWYQDILKLYRCGISQGSDAAGSFYPDAPITRGAAAAMLTRLADPVLRITPNWDLACDVPAPAGTTLASLVEPGTYIASPVTDAEMDSSIRYMLASGSNQLELTYPNISMVQARQVMEAIRAAADASDASIVTSALVLFCATLGVSFVSSIDLIGAICVMLARGALISAGVSLFIMPSVLCACEPLFRRTTLHWRTLPPAKPRKGRKEAGTEQRDDTPAGVS